METFSSADQYYRHLRNRGYVCLGKGLYSYVVAKPGSDRVIKIGRSADPWPAYIEWTIINDYMGTFGPRVYSLRFYPDFYVAIVERLVCTMTELHAESGYHKTPFNYLHGYMNDWINQYSVATSGDDLADLKTFCQKCTEAKFANDMHGGNVMLRKDGQIVLTDPCSQYQGEQPGYNKY